MAASAGGHAAATRRDPNEDPAGQSSWPVEYKKNGEVFPKIEVDADREKTKNW